MNNNVFIIVGLGNYLNASKRLYRQARKLGLSIDIVIIDESLINKIFDEQNISKKYLNNTNRGFGFWMWKPVVINYFLEKYNHVIYIDAGSELIKNSFLNLYNWFYNSEFNMILSPSGHEMESYTKMDSVVEFFNENEWKHLKKFQMFQAGVLFLKKSTETVKLFSILSKLIIKNRVDLFDDINRYQKNDTQFIDHRHDQSVFNLVIYKFCETSNFVVLPSSLTPPEHNQGFNSFPPILCLRNLSFLSYNYMYLIFNEQNKFPFILKLISRVFNLLINRFAFLHRFADFIFTKIIFIWAFLFHNKLHTYFKIKYQSKDNYSKLFTISQFNKEYLKD